MKQQESKTTLPPFVVQERAIVYARVSTDEQAESGTSIDNQVEKSIAYAQANNIQVVAIFKEDYTGKVLDRPELNKAREMLKAGKADNLIAYKTNRLDRSEWGLNLLLLMQELKSLGVELHYSQDNRRVDLHNPMEAFMYGSFAGWQAGEDHRETVTKLHEGRLNRAKSGYVVPHGKAPYGYRAVKGDDKKWHFEIREDEAAMVRHMFQWYVIGDETGKKLSMAKIADKLNGMGILAKKGGRWKRAAIMFILGNETYAGVWHYGKRQSRNKRRPTSESIPVEVPALVNREIWEMAREQLEHNKQYAMRNRKPGRYLLSCRLTCGNCNYGMHGVTKTKPNKTYSYYVCRNRHLTKREQLAECNNPSFHSQVIDAKVWQWVEETASDKDRLLDSLQGYQAEQESKAEPVRHELALVEELKKDKEEEWEEEMENLKILTSKRAKAKKAAEIEQIEMVLDELEKRKSNLSEQIEEKRLSEEQIIGISAFVAQVNEDLATLRQAEKIGKKKPELKKAVYEAKRKLLDILNVQVILFVKDGKKKARVTATFCPDGYVLSLEEGNICSATPARRSARTAPQNRPASRSHIQPS